MTIFESSRLKIKRADQHINNLKILVSDFLKTDFYTLEANYKTHIQQVAYRVVRVDPLPENVPLVLGDAIHNLRSALEHFMWETVDRFGGTPPDLHTSFPIAMTEQQYRSAFAKREITLLRKEIKEFISDVQPYVTGDNTLWNLHQLDITDKHQLIIPVASAATSMGLKQPRTWVAELSSAFHLELGEEICHIPIETYEKSHNNIQFGPAITFRNSEVFRGKTVIEALEHASGYIDMIITTVERKIAQPSIGDISNP